MHLIASVNADRGISLGASFQGFCREPPPALWLPPFPIFELRWVWVGDLKRVGPGPADPPLCRLPCCSLTPAPLLSVKWVVVCSQVILR